MTGAGDQFEVKLGRIRSPSGERRVEGFFKSVRRGAKRIGRTAERRRSGSQSQRSASLFHRRVLIKVSLVRMDAKGIGAQRLHLDYVERDCTSRTGERAELYASKGVDVDKADFIERGKEDRHQFRVIISPEDSRELASLTDFTRDLVSQMESDLGTKLDWVAADHYNTDQPHTHLVLRGKRDDGTDLVIPRDYISTGIRKRAEALVELELGPVTELEGRTRLAKMVTAERWTRLDYDLTREADSTSMLDTKALRDRLPAWKQRLLKRRLAELKRLGLAHQNADGRWRLNPDLRATLQRMGERGDIIKRLHRSLGEQNAGPVLASALFDPGDAKTRPVTGRVVSKGTADDVAGRAFVIVEAVDGRSVYAETQKLDGFADVMRGQIISLHPASLEPRASDRTITKIAGENGGHYSATLHMEYDTSSRPAFVEAHIRRLEALRRAGHVTRQSDGVWRIPQDYLARVRVYEQAMATRRPLDVRTHSTLRLKDMVEAMGATWLDHDWAERPDNPARNGFAREVVAARNARAKFLEREGMLGKGEAISEAHLAELQKRDLSDAGKELAGELGKPFRVAPSRGRVSGLYAKAVDRPSGKFAVIERAKDFTLVPWREVMERNLGKQINGVVRGNQISWTLTKGRGIS